MFVTFDLIPPLPPGFAKSYGALNYGNYGRGCWLYTPFQTVVSGVSVGPVGKIYSGEIEWINQQNWLSYPKYENPYGFSYFLSTGVLMTAQMNVSVNNNSAGAVFNGVATNIASGLGMAELLASF
jgi:hypothetical protein